MEKNKEYETLQLLKQSEKSTVYLVCAEGHRYIRKELAGPHPVYEVLRDHPHPGLPRLQEVVLFQDSTTVVEEYIEGQPAGTIPLSKKQYQQVVKELCLILEFLHGKGIIHRDIKPSNIIIGKDGHVYLIDFDAARMPRDGQEQDTRQLGTRGFAPPEQYGFSQTDERADIYALGVTLEQLLTEENKKPHYKKILRKCTNLDPDKRYQSVVQLRHALFPARRNILWSCAGVCLSALLAICIWRLPAFWSNRLSETAGGNPALAVLPTPGNVHWDGETGIAIWDNVPQSGIGGELQFHLRLYRQDTAAVPEPEDEDWYFEDVVRIGGSFKNVDVLSHSIVTELKENGIYYFTIAAIGDGIQYTDSPYAVSDAFIYTGESAPPLPSPKGLSWKLVEKDNTRYYYAVWNNLEDYEEKDMFNVTFYDEADTYVMNNTWSMEQITSVGNGGIYIPSQFLEPDRPGSAYRFTVQVYSSQPNIYSASLLPDPVPEEYFSPWLSFQPAEK